MLSIVDKLNEWMEPVKGWIDANHGNPIFWVAKNNVLHCKHKEL
jgi:hypothetical protein